MYVFVNLFIASPSMNWQQSKPAFVTELLRATTLWKHSTRWKLALRAQSPAVWTVFRVKTAEATSAWKAPILPHTHTHTHKIFTPKNELAVVFYVYILDGVEQRSCAMWTEQFYNDGRSEQRASTASRNNRHQPITNSKQRTACNRPAVTDITHRAIGGSTVANCMTDNG